MHSKGSRFTLGVWGLRVCSLDVAQLFPAVRSRSQLSTTVRARLVWPCLWQVLQQGSHLQVSSVALLRFAWQAWHFVTVVFRNVLKAVLCDKRALATFSEDALQFSWQAQHFRHVHQSIVILWGRHSTLVVLRAFCESHCQGCVKWRHGGNSVANVAFCEM